MRWTAQQLAQHEARRQQPQPVASRGGRLSRRRPIIEASENMIHEAVIGHLKLRCRPGIHWHHPATGELRDPGTAVKLQRMGVRSGLPDLLLVIEGRLHGLELKRERGGQLSPSQKAMHAELRAAGAVIETAKGLDEALAVLASWGALRPATHGGSQ